MRRFDPDPKAVTAATTLLRAAARYHRHRAIGLHRVPTAGRCLVVVNHSLVTYDIGLLGFRIWERTGRVPRGLGDRAIFRTPVVRRAAAHVGVVEGAPEAAAALLEAEELVVVAPGGMREALRSSRERYRLTWGGRRGFAALAVQTGAPVILAACPRADDVYRVYESPVTKAIYRRFRLPAPLVRGAGPSFVPRPVGLTHHLDGPFEPPAASSTDAEVDRFRARLEARMERLMVRALDA